MRLRADVARILVVPSLAVMAACAPPSTQSGSSSGASATGSVASSASVAPSSPSSSSPPSTLGPQVPADTAVAAAVPRDRMPTVTGSFGQKPTISVPSTPPPDTLQRVILSKGDGPTSKAGDWLVVNYLGQVWGGKVFWSTPAVRNEDASKMTVMWRISGEYAMVDVL